MIPHFERSPRKIASSVVSDLALEAKIHLRTRQLRENLHRAYQIDDFGEDGLEDDYFGREDLQDVRSAQTRIRHQSLGLVPAGILRGVVRLDDYLKNRGKKREIYQSI